jgi:hypothetical protein
MNADMKKLRQELLRGRARTLVFSGSQTRWVRYRCWRVVPLTPVRDDSFLWYERLAKLANRAVRSRTGND